MCVTFITIIILAFGNWDTRAFILDPCIQELYLLKSTSILQQCNTHSCDCETINWTWSPISGSWRSSCSECEKIKSQGANICGNKTNHKYACSQSLASCFLEEILRPCRYLEVLGLVLSGQTYFNTYSSGQNTLDKG